MNFHNTVLCILSFQLVVVVCADLNRYSPAQTTIEKVFSSKYSGTFDSRWLTKLLKKQSNNWSNDKGLVSAILNATEMAVIECADKFKYDRWNCTLFLNNKRKNIFKKVYRETAFIYSLGAAALMYSFSRACSEGKIKRCYCPSEKIIPMTKVAWGTRMCSDNLKIGRRLTKNFLQLKLGYDQVSDILHHNIEVGIQTITGNVKRECNCTTPIGTIQGVSGTICVNACVRRIVPFKDIVQILRKKYLRAKLINTANKASRSIKPKKKNNEFNQLRYLNNSTSFCSLTHGRKCSGPKNCKVMCCRRGHRLSEKNSICGKCWWSDYKTFDLKCPICSIKTYTCN